jgi:putative oxidoreductase
LGAAVALYGRKVIMNIILWVVQGLLALAFLLAGFMKATRPIDALSKRMAWVSTLPVAFVRFIGVAEVLGAIGLILPMVTDILPWLTAAAAAGLVVVQASAIIFHLSRNEARVVPGNAVLLLLAALVIIGRLAVAPVA